LRIKMVERAGFARHAPGVRPTPDEPAGQQGSRYTNTTYILAERAGFELTRYIKFIRNIKYMYWCHELRLKES
jgi:hypothetical protein